MKKVFFVCSGLGTTRRGYEMFFASLFDKAKHWDGVEVHLFKGGGASGIREHRLWNLPRRSKLAVWLGDKLKLGMAMLGRGYYVEQATFFVSLIPFLIWHRPAVIYFSDKDLGNLLARLRNWTNQSFVLIFRNGGPYPPPYKGFDLTQQLTAPLYEESIQAGCAPESLNLLPAGFDIPAKLQPLDIKEQTALRIQLGLPTDRTVLICVSAINASHKRVDYVINELAKLPEPRPYLQVLGQADAETQSLKTQAERLLGQQHFNFNNVDTPTLIQFYQAADMFVLGSIREGFGRVMVEAMTWGLPCLVHDYPISRYVLETHGRYANFEEDGALKALLEEELVRIGISDNSHDSKKDLEESFNSAIARHAFVYQRFSWDHLLPQYLSMLTPNTE